VCGGLAACDPPSQFPKEVQAKVDANAMYTACLTRAARSADDGKSEQADVVSKIIPMCASEFLEYQKVNVEGVDSAERKRIEMAAEEEQLLFARTAVFEERRARERKAN
jgi:hypothetical protein